MPTNTAPLRGLAGISPQVEGADVTLAYRDPTGALDCVRLLTELWKRERPRDFTLRDGTWSLRFSRPRDVDRIEYQLQLVGPRGETETVCDPGNPLRARGPWGDKSVLEFPEYEPPDWIDDVEAAAGEIEHFSIRARGVRAPVEGLLWSSPNAEPGRPAPLLVVHDGPEYAEYSLLTQLLASATAELELPPLRAALLQPTDRDEIYSASGRYAGAFARDVLPALSRLAPAPQRREARVGMGASLGALAMLHVHRLHPDTLGGLFLQSGSYFRVRSDRQESSFRRFGRIARFVGSVLRRRDWPEPIPIAMTCGTGEENLENNRAVRDALSAQGYPAALDEQRDAHNWVSWRDALDPHLVSLLQRLWG